MPVELQKQTILSPLMPKEERLCEHWWFGGWDRLVNCILAMAGRPTITTAPGDMAIDLHIHSMYSCCSISQPANLIRQAVRIGLGAIAVMDHDNIQGALNARIAAERLKSRGEIPPDFLVVPGVEVCSRAGHIGALFIEQNVSANRSPAETVDEIHSRGGLAIAVHPYNSRGIGDAVLDVPFDAVEIECGSVFSNSVLSRNKSLAENNKVAALAKLGSSDAHYVRAVGSCYTVVHDIERPTLDGLKKALMAGNCTPESSLPHKRIACLLGKIKKLR